MEDKIVFTIEGPRHPISGKSVKRGIALVFDPEWSLEQYLFNYGQALNALYEHEVNFTKKAESICKE